MNPEPTQGPSIPSLLRDLRDETTTLLRQEVALAKTELKENASRMGDHAMHIGVGAFVAYAGVIVLLIGLGQLVGILLQRAGVDPNVALWLAPTLLGLLVAIIGWSMVAKAKRGIAHDTLAPTQTIESLKDSKQWASRKLSHS
jgi:hypothetical protein